MDPGIIYAGLSHLLGRTHSWKPNADTETNCSVAVDTIIQMRFPDQWSKELRAAIRIWDHSKVWSSIEGPIAAGIADGVEMNTLRPGRWHVVQVWVDPFEAKIDGDGIHGGHTFLYYEPLAGPFIGVPLEEPHVLESTTATPHGFRPVESLVAVVRGRHVRICALNT